jgi:FkbM family methyltransferase
MHRALKDLAMKTLQRHNIAVTHYDNLEKLRNDFDRLTDSSSITSNDIDLILELPDQHSSRLLRALRISKSQLGQDLFVLSKLDFKRGGFFVEFGATNGIDLSNTYLLEKEFGWKGILAEPAKRWHEGLRNNRTGPVETDCVWSDSTSTLPFNEVDIGELSTIAFYGSSDGHADKRKQGKAYDVKTISLEDLLDKYHAPKEIDYLSIDTEGSEFQILSSFDFDRYEIKLITCEHNFTPTREKICSLLTQNGYVREFEELSRWDDWYVRTDRNMFHG